MIVRRDLPEPHRAVQSIHAAIEAEKAYPSKRLETPNVVLCEVPDEDALLREFERLKADGVPVVCYSEPDFGNERTAVATGRVIGAARKKLRSLKLYRVV